ncbi:MAG: ABC transporter permease [Burkholderiaceae bacterium]
MEGIHLGSALVSIVFDGLAYAMILFVISVGLTVTMGLMGFVNLAHGVFAMAGGYFAVALMSEVGMPFLVALPLAALLVGAISLVLEPLFYRPLYRAGELDQVLLSIGLVLIATGVFTWVFGPDPVHIDVPEWLSGQVDLGIREVPCKLVMIVTGLAMAGLLWFGFEKTLLGARVRAAVDNQQMAQCVGIDVNRLFKAVFALGSAIAALGGGLAVEILGMSPIFGIQYLVIFLIVVAVGGLGTITGTFVAAIVLGVIDNAGKYLWPEGGAFFIYAVTIAALLLRRTACSASRMAEPDSGVRSGIRRSPPTPAAGSRTGIAGGPGLPWVAALLVFWWLPNYVGFGAQVLLTIVFALSIDLIVGYAGIVSLGHAAFFGLGAYASGMAAAHWGWSEPISSLLLAAGVAGAVGLASGAVLLRYHGLTLLMLTLATAAFLRELANANEHLTGGFDGLSGIAFDPVLGLFDYDLWGKTFYLYNLAVLLVVFLICRRIVHSPFGQSLVGLRENRLRMQAIGAPVYRRMVAIYTVSAAIAGIAGGLFAQTNTFVTLDVLDFSRSGTILIIIILGGLGRLYGAFAGAVLYMVLEDELAKLSPEFWEIGVGLVLVLMVLFARGGLLGWVERLSGRGARPK